MSHCIFPTRLSNIHHPPHQGFHTQSPDPSLLLLSLSPIHNAFSLFWISLWLHMYEYTCPLYTEIIYSMQHNTAVSLCSPKLHPVSISGDSLLPSLGMSVCVMLVQTARKVHCDYCKAHLDPLGYEPTTLPHPKLELYPHGCFTIWAIVAWANPLDNPHN